jgi:hypothetical protein
MPHCVMSRKESKQSMMTSDCISVLGDFDFLVLIVETSWFVLQVVGLQ